MNTIKIECLEHLLREKYEYDYNGNLLKGEKSRNIIIEFPIKIYVQNMPFTILVCSEMSRDGVELVDNYLHYAFLKSEKRIIEILQKCNELEIFSKLMLYVNNNSDAISIAKGNVNYSMKEPIVVEINDTLYDNMINSAKYYVNITLIIQKVIDKLKSHAFDLTSHGHELFKDKLLSYCSFLKYCYEKSYNYLGPNYREMLSDIYKAINELARRKIENNFNYQNHKQKIKERSFLLQPPEIWKEKPFIPDEILKEFKVNT